MSIAARRTKPDIQMKRAIRRKSIHPERSHAPAERHIPDDKAFVRRNRSASTRNRIIPITRILSQIYLQISISLNKHLSRRRKHDIGRCDESDGYHAVVSVASDRGVRHGEAGWACGACGGDGEVAGVGGVGYGCERCREAGGVAAVDRVDAVRDIAAGVDGERQVGCHAQIVGSGEDDV